MYNYKIIVKKNYFFVKFKKIGGIFFFFIKKKLKFCKYFIFLKLNKVIIENGFYF